MPSPSEIPPIERLSKARLLALSDTEDNTSPLSLIIYKQIREALLRGVLSSGDCLNIRPIAAAFGTSTMPVREALTRLVADGALSARANRAFIVPEISERKLREIYLMRLRLEVLAAEHAATRQTLETLQVAQELMQALENPESPAEYLAAHRSFHFHIYAAADMPLLLETIETLWLRMGPILTKAMGHMDLEEECVLHRDILNALSTGDAARAGAAVEADLRTALARMIRGGSGSLASWW